MSPEEKLRQTMIRLFGYDHNQPRTIKKFIWPWKSKKPVVRVYSGSGGEVKDETKTHDA